MSSNTSIHAVFSARARATPASCALLDDTRQLTYGELDRSSDALAARLAARGITRGDRVGLYAQRSIDATIALLGILKAGAAYVPFDPAYPVKLLGFVYQDCAPALMLVQPDMVSADRPAFWSGPALDLTDALAGAGASSVTGPEAAVTLREVSVTLPEVSAEDLAYVMYTSGSTGHPKGVLIPHRGVTRLVIDNNFATMDASQVHLQLAPLAFDASTFEIWGALLNGAKLAIVPASHPSLDDIAQHIARHGVTTLWLTAGLFHLMVDHRLAGLRGVKQLMAGGDVLSAQHIAKAQAGLPDCQFINGYGPTENTTFTCCYRIPHAAPSGAIPIGRPIAHTDVYVVDDAGREVSEGQEGELLTGGAGVALGYLNRPELTAERFVPNRFANATTHAIATASSGSHLLYRTGDRVRRRPDGNFEFLGRVDRQVKINGKRVELDEIEAILRRSPMVEDAAVTAPALEGQVRRVLAYVKLKANIAGGVTELRAFLKQELADYMLPSAITVLAELPLSPTGKVDRARLSLPQTAAPSPGPAPALAANATEATLLGIWRTVLGTPTVGLDDNFFDLGGTSLQLVQVQATITTVMKSDVTMVDLFQYPRISALAAYMAADVTAPLTSPGGSLTPAERARRQQAALSRARAMPRRTVP